MIFIVLVLSEAVLVLVIVIADSVCAGFGHNCFKRPKKQ